MCTQCARQLGMIGDAQGGADPFAMLQNLIQQQQGGQGSLFDALSGEAQQAVMRAREASAGHDARRRPSVRTTCSPAS